MLEKFIGSSYASFFDKMDAKRGRFVPLFLKGTDYDLAAVILNAAPENSYNNLALYDGPKRLSPAYVDEYKEHASIAVDI